MSHYPYSSEYLPAAPTVTSSTECGAKPLSRVTASAATTWKGVQVLRFSPLADLSSRRAGFRTGQLPLHVWHAESQGVCILRVSTGGLQGGHIGLPNLFGFFAPHPQQVGESNTLTLRNPKEPILMALTALMALMAQWSSNKAVPEK